MKIFKPVVTHANLYQENFPKETSGILRDSVMGVRLFWSKISHLIVTSKCLFIFGNGPHNYVAADWNLHKATLEMYYAC